VETVKLKSYLQTFNLDKYGKHGIEMSSSEEEDAEQQAPAQGQDAWYQHPIHKHQNRIRIRFVKEPLTHGEWIPPSREI